MSELTADLPWFYRFHDLMPFRVREVLLVSSPYDAFTLEEDGRLTERLFLEYSELNLPAAPRITAASSGARALAMVQERRFDLVITMSRLEDVDVSGLAKKIKALDPRLPVVLLGSTDRELDRLARDVDRDVVDGVFVWTGNASIFFAAIKLIEDKMNVAHDTRVADVRVILVVEDSVRRYSSFLSVLYQELMTQASTLIAEGVNEVHKVTRMRARPKILLATTYEEAVEILSKYEDAIFAVLSDARFPREGKEDPDAGFALLELIRTNEPDLPFFLQSAEASALQRAHEMGIPSAHKNSPRLNREIQAFVAESMGFGDFIFRLPDGPEVARARDLYEMEDILHTVPAASIRYHADHNHFSRWLMARTLFHMARELRPRTLEGLGGAEGVRSYTIEVLRQARMAEQQGMITNFSEHHVRTESPFVRVGQGSIGGKARGLAFVNSLLARRKTLRAFDGLEIRTPRTVAIGTDEFDRFMEDNGLTDRIGEQDPEPERLSAFLDGKLSAALRRPLEMAWRKLRGPLAVRSSSLLEDSQFQPFAGIYATYKITNHHISPEVRFDELCRAIKAVYASTYCPNARAYMSNTPHSLEDEKMGVVIQELVGRRFHNRYYPAISGVAVSYNFYPVGGQKAEDGLVLLALGLGQQVVQGGRALAFSPRSPHKLPQYSSAFEMQRRSQTQFYALDMSNERSSFLEKPEWALSTHPLRTAETDGVLSIMGSVYDAQDDVIRDDLRRPGPRVVSFNNILKYHSIPLAPAMQVLLQEARHGMGCPVELEFAVDVPRGGGKSILYVLQVRPQARELAKGRVDVRALPNDVVLARSDHALGHGVYRDLYDVVHVRCSTLDPARSNRLAQQVGQITQALRADQRPYVLVGPGRWGSSDPTLGIPVDWAQIAGVSVVVETCLSDRLVEPSQGSHFFHNLTSLQLAYLSARHLEPNDERSFLDAGWLDEQPAALADGPELRHVRLEAPLIGLFDGTRGEGALVKPGHTLTSEGLDADPYPPGSGAS